MRIVHISVGGVPVLHPFGGAVQRRILELGRQQVANGHEVVVYSPDETTGIRTHEGMEIRSYRCRTGARLSWIEIQVRAALDLMLRQFRGGRPDIVHVHNQAEGALITRLVRSPKVLAYDYFYFRRGLRGPLRWLYRRSLRTYDALLPVSIHCRDESDRYWDLSGTRLRIIHNGVNIEQFRPDPAAGQAERDRAGLAGKLVVYIGRVNEQKGTDVLLEAMRLLADRGADARLVIAGPIGQFGHGDTGQADPGDWRARITAVGGTYLGAVAEERLAGVYNMADVFVMPTTQFEMFGMSAVEAQACGKPTVASDNGGLTETVPEDCGGRFPAGDAPALADRIEAILAAEPDDYEAMSRRARANAGIYAWPAVNARLEAVYAEIAR